MAKTIKPSHLVSTALRTGRSQHQHLQNSSLPKIQRANTRPVLVAVSKNNQVQPAASLIREAENANEHKNYLTLSFREAFGVLGVPIVATLVVCVFWTNWLICIALIPNQAANWLMGTMNYDHGQFWLIVDTNPAMINAGAAGLVFVDFCYLYVIVKMLRWRTTILRLQQTNPSFQEDQRIDSATDSWVRTASARFKTQYVEFTSFRGSKRKLLNVLLKIFNLVMHMTVLLELLENGSPRALVYGYTTFISAGSLAGAVKILIGTFSAMGEVIAGSVFDLFAAIVYPILVLVYCYYNFQFDDAVFASYLKILPVGSFELSARVFADPSEIALFLLAFDSLRIKFLLEFILHIGINLTFCYRLKRIGDVLVAARLKRAQALKAGEKRRSNLQRPVPRVFAVFFIAFSILVWVFANQTIKNSTARCSRYPQCVVYAYRWKFTADLCPCRILIDADRAPQTYEEWTRPVDVYSSVQALALAGELRSLQIINRRLLELPEELRTCRQLSSMELIYTSIQSIPPWTKEFKFLQTLHLEGKVGSQNLLSLPDDLFSDMPWLSKIHIGIQPDLANFPALTGVPNLQSVTLAWLLSIRTLPPLENLPRLQSLVLALMPSLEQLPDLAQLRSLSDFTLSRPTQLCCNGFRGICDLTDSYCVENPSSGVPEAICFAGKPFLGNAGTRDVFDRFHPTICKKLPSDMQVIPGAPNKKSSEMCDNKPFAQCKLPDGGTGICYNTRMQVLSCYGDEDYIKLRRYQIKLGVGQQCDPVLEKWLGCSE